MKRNDLDIAHFQTLLESERNLLLQELQESGHPTGYKDDWEAQPMHQDVQEPDFVDQADTVIDFQERIASLSELEIRLGEVDKALQKIALNDGTYGICEVSGEPIEIERLEANPAAPTSIANMK
jgi:DnaK suppressor protein